MLVSHKHEFIYTKTAKTAGTSVELFFEPFCRRGEPGKLKHGTAQHVDDTGIVGYRGGARPAGVTWYSHMPAEAIARKLGREIWSRYFKFCVIRNPYDKLVSGFHHFDHRGDLSYLTETDTIMRFREWIYRGGCFVDRNKYVTDGSVVVDYFVMFENLVNDLKYVCARLGIPFHGDRLKRYKAGFRDHGFQLSDYYDAETARNVEEKYEFELEYFGYSLRTGTSGQYGHGSMFKDQTGVDE